MYELVYLLGNVDKYLDYLGKTQAFISDIVGPCYTWWLCSINFCNYDVICCSDAACDRSDHKAEIESLYHHSYNCLINATKQCFSQRRPNSDFKCVHGWNEYVYEAKAAASDAHYLWCQWNKPKFGPLFDLMRRTRAKYKYAIRHCRQQEKQIQADTLPQHLSKQNFSSFWRKVSKTVSPSMPNSSEVGQATGPNDICSMLYSHYQSLFTSVGYDRPTVNGIIANVHLRNTDVIKYSTCSEIRDVLATMNNNKSADCYGLCAEHYKLAGDLYCSFLALCFNAMFLHGYIPADSTQTLMSLN